MLQLEPLLAPLAEFREASFIGALHRAKTSPSARFSFWGGGQFFHPIMGAPGNGKNGHFPRSPWGPIYWENRVSARQLLGGGENVQKPLVWLVRYVPENRGEQAPLVHGIGSARPGKTGGQ